MASEKFTEIASSKTLPRLLLLIVLIQIMNISCVEGLYFPQKIHVTIRNNLGGGFTLRLHCKSKDDDLGLQVLPPNAVWGFKFNVSILGNTQFFCRVEWPGIVHYFDVFVQIRDIDICSNCNWSITQDRPPCLKFEDESKNRCLKYWNSLI